MIDIKKKKKTKPLSSNNCQLDPLSIQSPITKGGKMRFLKSNKNVNKKHTLSCRVLCKRPLAPRLVWKGDVKVGASPPPIWEVMSRTQWSNMHWPALCIDAVSVQVYLWAELEQRMPAVPYCKVDLSCGFIHTLSIKSPLGTSTS